MRNQVNLQQQRTLEIALTKKILFMFNASNSSWHIIMKARITIKPKKEETEPDLNLKGQYHGRSMGDIMIFGQNSLNLNFEHCVNKFLNR